MGYDKSLNGMNFAHRKYDGWKQVERSITFDGGTTNATGDFNGTGEPHNIFTVTGTVTMRLIAVCTTSLVIDATATLQVGTAITSAGIIALEAGDAIDVNEIWHDTTSDASVELGTVAPEFIVNQDVIGTTATANITAGVIKYLCLWKPISSDGEVVAA